MKYVARVRLARTSITDVELEFLRMVSRLPKQGGECRVAVGIMDAERQRLAMRLLSVGALHWVEKQNRPGMTLYELAPLGWRVLLNYTARTLEDVDAHRGPPPEPTLARPGSDEKIEVMRRRWEQGYGLWHPGDKIGASRLETGVWRVRSLTFNA